MLRRIPPPLYACVLLTALGTAELLLDPGYRAAPAPVVAVAPTGSV